jgi:hypothetical protein
MSFHKFFAAFILVCVFIGVSSTCHAQDAFAFATATPESNSTTVLEGQSTVLADGIASAVLYDEIGFVGFGVVFFDMAGEFQMIVDSPSTTSSLLEAILLDENDDANGTMLIVVVQEPDSATESKKIGEGHAYDKHVLGTNNTNGKEFEKDKEINGKKFPRDSITTKQQFVDFIKEIMDNTTVKKESTQQPGKWYYWHDETGTIVIYNPNHNDHGTCFRPDKGKDYYDNSCK